MVEEEKKTWVAWTVGLAFLGVVLTLLFGALGPAPEGTGEQGLPQGAAQAAVPTTWEGRYVAAVAGLQAQSDRYFAQVTTMQVDLAGAKARVDQLRAQVADTESAIGRLDEAILAATPGEPLTALGRRYPSVEGARETLATWLSDYKERQASLRVAIEGRERLASSVEALKRYRAKIQQHIITAQASFEAKRAELRATEARREIAAMELAATRLARPGAAQDLAAVLADLDRAILSEQQGADLTREDVLQGQHGAPPGDALRALPEERARAEDEDILQRLREQRAAGAPGK